jgi:hypothetical protein
MHEVTAVVSEVCTEAKKCNTPNSYDRRDSATSQIVQKNDEQQWISTADDHFMTFGFLKHLVYGDLMKDVFKFSGHHDIVVTNFLDILGSDSLPFDSEEADGYLGLMSKNKKEDSNQRNFLDQLYDQGLIKNKVFSIFVGGVDAHIKFGSWDQGAIQNDRFLSMFESTNQTFGYGVKFTKFSIGGTDIELNGGYAQTAVFDPSLPYIYMPEADFKLVSKQMN